MREIANKKLFMQRIYWGDLDFNGLTFTDIDAYMNYFEKVLIIVEMKKQGKSLGFAQKRAFETLCNNSKIDCVFIIAWHNEKNTESYVMMKDCIVESFLYKGKWNTDRKVKNLYTFIKSIIDYYDKENS